MTDDFLRDFAKRGLSAQQEVDKLLGAGRRTIPAMGDIKVINETGHALDVQGAADATGVRLVVRDGLQRPSMQDFIGAVTELRNCARDERELGHDVAYLKMTGEGAHLETAESLERVAAWLEALNAAR